MTTRATIGARTPPATDASEASLATPSSNPDPGAPVVPVRMSGAIIPKPDKGYRVSIVRFSPAATPVTAK
jgi:hypothetical protein